MGAFSAWAFLSSTLWSSRPLRPALHAHQYSAWIQAQPAKIRLKRPYQYQDNPIRGQDRMHETKVARKCMSAPAAKRSRLAAYCSPLGSTPVAGRARGRPLEKGTSSADAPSASPFHWWHPSTRVARVGKVSRGRLSSAADSAAAVAARTPALGLYVAAAALRAVLAAVGALAGRLCGLSTLQPALGSYIRLLPTVRCTLSYLRPDCANKRHIHLQARTAKPTSVRALLLPAADDRIFH